MDLLRLASIDEFLEDVTDFAIAVLVVLSLQK